VQLVCVPINAQDSNLNLRSRVDGGRLRSYLEPVAQFQSVYANPISITEALTYLLGLSVHGMDPGASISQAGLLFP
jgi:hypothetical protein